MKKFKFRYESIHKMRMDKEEKVKNDLASLINEKQKLSEELTALMQRQNDYFRWLESALSKGISSTDRSQIENGKTYYKTHIQLLREKIALQDEKIAKKQSELVDAMKERKIMDKLKEKALEDYIEEYNAQDMKMIEEIVNYKNNHSVGE